VTRRPMTMQEIDDADFKAFLASSSSSSESDPEDSVIVKSDIATSKNKSISREKLRALLLDTAADGLPEGWNAGDGNVRKDVDMEITFTPGLSEAKNGESAETTLQAYQRKIKEKRKGRKETIRTEKIGVTAEDGAKDEFFETRSGGESDKEGKMVAIRPPKKAAKKGRISRGPKTSPRVSSTADELALLATPDNLSTETKHFDLKSVLKAEAKHKGKQKKRKTNAEETDTQEGFAIDVEDHRFRALHEDPTFAIDPSNPQCVYILSLLLSACRLCLGTVLRRPGA
jgi:hypothetical protein